MSKIGKRFNWRARQSTADDGKQVTQKKQLKTEIDIEFNETKYDSSNPLVLDTKTLKTTKPKVLPKNRLKTKVLSKNERKKLQKVLERKNRKINRAKLLIDLQEFKAEDREIALMSSTSDVQTCGRKRYDYNKMESLSEEIDEKNLIKYKKYKKLKKMKVESKQPKDLNVIGVSDDSDSDCESDGQSSDSVINDFKCETNSSEVINSETIEVKESEKNEIQSKINTIEENNEKIIENESKSETKIIEKIQRDFVQIFRTTDIEKFRSNLPIVSEEHTIMDAIFNNPIVIICGETGSGKTTQVPQFLFEAGFTQNGQIIGVTEPRRVAAIAMSRRVGHEMNVSDKEVSFQIRFETNATQETIIKFMTDGVLLKEIQNDFLLNKYSVIIIDEAHERSLFSDILIGLLSRIVPLRHKKQNPLKLIIMSATLRVEDFTTNNKLFKTVPPVIKIDCRQFPVSVHFNKKTNSDYLYEAFKKICKIHNECPNGGILVFLTGRVEVEVLCRRLRAKYPNNSYKNPIEPKVMTKKFKNKQKRNENSNEKKRSNAEKIQTINLDDYDVNPLESERTLDDFDYSDDENDDQLIEDNDSDEDEPTFYSESQALHCLPLYSLLPNSQQSLVFKEPPIGTRLCVVATNVAETSLTIPNIKYVVDSGKAKTKVYDNVTGISTFVIGWTSKASADQRAGRAGRTAPGHCYRLYSSAIFNDEFPQYSEPEILRKPTDDLLLQMKAMNIENVVNFPFPSQPSTDALFAAEKRLISMGALKKDLNKAQQKSNNFKAKITPLGRAMSHFPINPRYAKMLALSRQHQLMPYTIAIVSALTIQEIFINSGKSGKNLAICRMTGSGRLLGDVMVLLNSIGAAQYAGLTQQFCKQNGLRYKAMIEINKLRKQLSSQISQICDDLSEDLTSSLDMSPPNDLQIKLLRQIMLSGFFDRIARKVPVLDIDLDDKEKKKLRNAYQSIEVEKPVFIGSQSVLSDELPEYVIYQEIFETSRLQMRNVVAIEAEWLPLFVANSCKLSNPLENPSPRYDMSSDCIKCFRSSTFGPYDWPIKATELLYPEGLESYKYFAKFLLEGHVIEFFKTYATDLLSSPTIITKSWASLQPRTERFLKSLVSENINNRKSLYNKWKSDPNYLLKEYMDWLPKSCQQKVKSCWPPVSQNN